MKLYQTKVVNQMIAQYPPEDFSSQLSMQQMEMLRIKYLIFYLEGPRLDSELIGFRLVLESGQHEGEFQRDFGMKTPANN